MRPEFGLQGQALVDAGRRVADDGIGEQAVVGKGGGVLAEGLQGRRRGEALHDRAHVGGEIADEGHGFGARGGVLLATEQVAGDDERLRRDRRQRVEALQRLAQPRHWCRRGAHQAVTAAGGKLQAVVVETGQPGRQAAALRARKDRQIFMAIMFAGMFDGGAGQQFFHQFEAFEQHLAAVFGGDPEITELLGKGAAAADTEQQAAAGQGVDRRQVFGDADRIVERQQYGAGAELDAAGLRRQVGEQGQNRGADAESIEMVFSQPDLLKAQLFGMHDAVHRFAQGAGGVVEGVFEIGEQGELGHGGLTGNAGWR